MIKRSYAILVPSVAVYIGSLLLPAFEFRHHAPVMGIDVLIWGWFGFLFLNPAWLANPVFMVTTRFLMAERYRLAVLSSFCAVLLGLMSPLAKVWCFDEGMSTPIDRFGPAFYVWMASLCILLVGSLWIFLAETRH